MRERNGMAPCRFAGKIKIPGATTAQAGGKRDLIARHEGAGMPPGAPGAPAGRTAQPGTTGAQEPQALLAPRGGGRSGALAGVRPARRRAGAAGAGARRLPSRADLRQHAQVPLRRVPGSEPLGYTVLLRLMLLARRPGDGRGDPASARPGHGRRPVRRAAAAWRGRWLAALAVAPVLLDAYQIQMEQTIMPDVWFEAMIVAALVAGRGSLAALGGGTVAGAPRGDPDD